MHQRLPAWLAVAGFVCAHNGCDKNYKNVIRFYGLNKFVTNIHPPTLCPGQALHPDVSHIENNHKDIKKIKHTVYDVAGTWHAPCSSSG